MTYLYRCDACEREWEAVQKITDDPIDICRHCGERKAHRLIATPAPFVLKGGGWHADLYGSVRGYGNKADK